MWAGKWADLTVRRLVGKKASAKADFVLSAVLTVEKNIIFINLLFSFFIFLLRPKPYISIEIINISKN